MSKPTGIVYVLLVINALLFLALSILHIYWAFGGKWAMANAVPQKAGKDQKAFIPGKGATLLVAAGLLGFALLHAAHLFTIDQLLLRNISRYGLLVVGCIFLLRVIGDFNYVGLTKSVRYTAFARLDNNVYIPLCAYLSISSLFCYWWLFC